MKLSVTTSVNNLFITAITKCHTNMSVSAHILWRRLESLTRCWMMSLESKNILLCLWALCLERSKTTSPQLGHCWRVFPPKPILTVGNFVPDFLHLRRPPSETLKVVFCFSPNGKNGNRNNQFDPANRTNPKMTGGHATVRTRKQSIWTWMTKYVAVLSCECQESQIHIHFWTFTRVTQ